MVSRVQALARHLCIGEMENREVDPEVEGGRMPPAKKGGDARQHPTFRFRFVRETIKIVYTDKSAADERYGGAGDKAIVEGELIRPNTVSRTVAVFMHPSGIQNLLPMPVAMARSGLHVCTCCSRYPNNDTCLIMEKVVLDLGACIRHLKQQLGYTTVLLAGWSGGGAMANYAAPGGHAQTYAGFAGQQRAGHPSQAGLLSQAGTEAPGAGGAPGRRTGRRIPSCMTRWAAPQSLRRRR